MAGPGGRAPLRLGDESLERQHGHAERVDGHVNAAGERAVGQRLYADLTASARPPAIVLALGPFLNEAGAQEVADDVRDRGGVQAAARRALAPRQGAVLTQQPDRRAAVVCADAGEVTAPHAVSIYLSGATVTGAEFGPGREPKSALHLDSHPAAGHLSTELLATRIVDRAGPAGPLLPTTVIGSHAIPG